MEIIYLYIDKWKNIEKEGFNFSPRFSCRFEVEVHTINYHIKNIFKQKELDKISTIRKIRIVQKEGISI